MWILDPMMCTFVLGCGYSITYFVFKLTQVFVERNVAATVASRMGLNVE